MQLHYSSTIATIGKTEAQSQSERSSEQPFSVSASSSASQIESCRSGLNA
jgi:hypothetical protein